jgi:hypothetical protein
MEKRHVWVLGDGDLDKLYSGLYLEIIREVIWRRTKRRFVQHSRLQIVQWKSGFMNLPKLSAE